jgi:hypothetical protein
MKHIITMTVLLCLQVAAFAQITPSVYVGIGSGANLGGDIGIGTEVKYQFVSANAAIGTWAQKFPEHTGAKSRLGYDVGLKVYPIKGWFLGVNYGVMNEALYTEHSPEGWHFQKEYGFSFTTGYRWHFYKGLYGLAYVGITESKEVNKPTVMGMQMFIPRLGLVFGWDFLTKDNLN